MNLDFNSKELIRSIKVFKSDTKDPYKLDNQQSCLNTIYNTGNIVNLYSRLSLSHRINFLGTEKKCNFFQKQIII